MAICPKCGKEINGLEVEETVKFHHYYNKDGSLEDMGEEEKEEIFKCPECGEPLFFDADKAFDFLNSRVEIKTDIKKALEKLIRKELEGINYHHINFKVVDDGIIFENVLNDCQERTIKSWFE